MESYEAYEKWPLNVLDEGDWDRSWEDEDCEEVE